MSMRTIAKCLPLVALGFVLSGCMAPVEEPVTISNNSDTIVTPWDAPAGTAPSRQASSTMQAPDQMNDNLIMMEDPKRKALDQMQQKQIDEARIALGILDRMAQRCVQGGDAAACTTLQSNWGTLSQQLHKTLSMMSGNASAMPLPDPFGDEPMPSMNQTAPMQPTMDAPAMDSPAMNAPVPGSDNPSMEKIIPMTEPGSDG
jgi:hypothetical protein